ncbi:Metalloprotease TldD [anaerobic digester metagenome]
MMYEVANKTLDIALKHAENAEIYVEREESVDVDIKNDKVDFAKEVISLGVGVRVIIDGKMGFAHTTNTGSTEELGRTVERAVFNAHSNVADENFAFAAKAKYPSVKGLYDRKIEAFEIEEAVNFAQTMINTVSDQKCQPTSGGFAAGSYKSLLLNSEGADCQDISTGFAGYISVNAEDGEAVSTAHESDSSTHFDVNPETIAQKACQVALDSRGGKSIDTGDLMVILDYDAAAGLLSTFSNALNADNVQRGRSLFADKLGEEVVSSSLSIYDDGTLENGLNSSNIDGEGTPTQKTTLIEKGVLKNFLYDIYTSRKGGVESTGNGMRGSYADIPSVGMSNFIVEFGSINELSEVENGIFVRDVLGAHTANPISGDFSVEAMNAFKVKNGEIAYPVKKAMISGNIFQSLKKASAASKTSKQRGPFVIPQIFIQNMRVVG